MQQHWRFLQLLVQDGYKGDGFLCEGEYLVRFLQLEYKVMFTLMI